MHIEMERSHLGAAWPASRAQHYAYYTLSQYACPIFFPWSKDASEKSENGTQRIMGAV